MELHGKILAEGLINRGHTLDIITTRHPQKSYGAGSDNLRLHYLKNTKFGSYIKGWKKECINKLVELNNIPKFDIIWSQSYAGYPYTLDLKKELGIPMVSILQGTVAQAFSSLLINKGKSQTIPLYKLSSLVRTFYDYFFVHLPVLKNSDIVICVSKEIEQEVRRFYVVKNLDTRVIFNGIDCQQCAPNHIFRDQTRSKYSITNQEILLLTLGTLTKEKGHHVALKILKALADQGFPIKLIIVGAGPFKDTLETMASEMGLRNRVIFVGHVSNEDTPAFYNAADIYLFPSFRKEGLPLTVIEAMSCGKPIVATRSGSLNGVVKNGFNGFLFPRGNLTAATDFLKILLKDQALARSMSVNARNLCLKSFNKEIMLDLTIKTFQSLLTK